MHKVEYVLTALAKIEQTVERVLANSLQITRITTITCRLRVWSVLRAPACCSLPQARALKVLIKELLPQYPQVDWKGAMGIRDIIAHHYFELDAEVVFDVVKNEFPNLLQTIRRMRSDLETPKDA